MEVELMEEEGKWGTKYLSLLKEEEEEEEE